ncbi:hypothetical protein [Pleionea sediminis]|uniref:hypothetical protein n=1 Tax=Pleionea sediminis TaxID=2569479 RepID=UPI0011867E06|nr:hypothetical protein [Pleionea sediminis]
MKDLSLGCANSYPVHATYIFKFGTDVLTICDHDFEPAIDIHKPSENGWYGFCLQYHCHEPWNDLEWEIENLEELIGLLDDGIKQVEESFFSNAKCELLLDFLIRAKSSNENVSITRE